jgi:hypothetical protein
MVIGNNVVTLAGLFTTCGLMILGLLATYPASKAYEKGRRFVNGMSLAYCFSLRLSSLHLLLKQMSKNSSATERRDYVGRKNDNPYRELLAEMKDNKSK